MMYAFSQMFPKIHFQLFCMGSANATKEKYNTFCECDGTDVLQNLIEKLIESVDLFWHYK